MNRTMYRTIRQGGCWNIGITVMAVCIGSLLPGCDALNPSFVDFVASTFPESGAIPEGPDSRGHVVVVLRNDMVFDQQMVDLLIGRGMDPSVTEDDDFRPRVRMLVQITFTNNEQLLWELNDGSSRVVDPSVDLTTLPELTRTPLDNTVVQCDVARVELVGLPSVFVPIGFQTVRIDPGDENTSPFRVNVNTVVPQFIVLQEDDLDQSGNTVVFRNINIRDRPAPAVGPNCGSVVTIIMSGTLRVPFVVNAFNLVVPGVLNTDTLSRAASPGRFSIVVGIR